MSIDETIFAFCGWSRNMAAETSASEANKLGTALGYFGERVIHV